ncbi:hypothetical protein ABGT15_05755 [Flavobacterium enshiense]|uniref:hypothetical protein n=1 Tax=Flavobacterium enshiense TaxID=1341165 RepID=UPI00345D48C6
MKLLYNFIFVFLIIQSGVGQTSNEYSYAIWISKYERNWIDSEDSFFIVDMNSNSFNLESSKSSMLILGDDYDAQLCCKMFIPEQKNSGHYNENELFKQNKVLKIKDGNLTIHILKLKSSNCECTTRNVSKFEGIDPPILVKFLLNYETLKLSTSEKRKLRKEKEFYRKLLRKNSA